MSSDPVAPIIAESEKNLPLPEVSNEPKRPTRFYEECDPSSPKEYYPLTLGTKLKGINVAEYVVLRKIGWGSDSTVWMARGSCVAFRAMAEISSFYFSAMAP